MNEHNLIPIKTSEEAKQKGSVGGKKSGKVRRERKAMKKQMELLLSLPCKNEDTIGFIKDLGIERRDR